MRRQRQTKVARRAFKKKQALDISYIVFCALLVSAIGYHFQHSVKFILVSPVSTVHAQTAVLTPDSNTNPTQDEIESYIRRIFVEDPDTAVAISRTECPNLAQYNYPHCIMYSTVERSIGIFEINLYNAEQKVHADRIPGTTMEEKEAWLQNPFNNTLYAHWIYETNKEHGGTGWDDWSTFTSGKYEENL